MSSQRVCSPSTKNLEMLSIMCRMNTKAVLSDYCDEFTFWINRPVTNLYRGWQKRSTPAVAELIQPNDINTSLLYRPEIVDV